MYCPSNDAADWKTETIVGGFSVFNDLFSGFSDCLFFEQEKRMAQCSLAHDSAFSESSPFSCNSTSTILQSEQDVGKTSHRRTMAY